MHRRFLYSCIFKLYFYLSINAWQFVESHDGKGDYYGKEMQFICTKLGTVGANVLQKKMRCMQ